MIKAFVFDAYGTLYDTQSVTDIIGAAFPDRADYVSQVWRMKQLEYSWLRSMMGRYEDFWTVTREALEYTLRTTGLSPDPGLFDSIADAYNKLAPYPDASTALEALAPFRLAILSNGSPAMLSQVTHHSGLASHLEKVISVDSKRVFKPDRKAYELVGEELGLQPGEVAFVSSNGFDVCGAAQFGFTVIRVERISPAALSQEIESSRVIAPKTMFKALRTQMETCGAPPHHTIRSLAELPELAKRLGH